MLGDAAVTQQSLSSSSPSPTLEFQKRNSRSWNVKPASTSLFEWALSVERVQEEIVGVGR